ncbi:MAG TPA: tetratricopeptide repeat protein [Candidatus Acidoferrales bacterium]|nr:tetratricopeptide repeat protein [Candidatus Acidoferrales bacterium]
MADSDRYAEVAGLLRDVDRPYRLRGHRLLTNRPGLHPRQLVEEAVEQLPPRFRTIVTRCDLAKERHAAVAAQLGISERHFYRERRKAILALGEALESLTRRAPALAASAADPATAPLSLAGAFANVGRHDDAIRLLDRALLDTPTAQAFVAIATRLAQLCFGAGEAERAFAYLSDAELRSTGAVPRLEAATMRAELLLRRGQVTRAKHDVLRTIRTLNALGEAPSTRRARALVNAHLVLVDVCDDLDEFGAGLEAAIEAVATARRYDLEPALRLRARLTLAQMRMLTATPASDLLDHLAADYEFAQTHGLPHECADSAGLFCVLYSYSGEHARALSFGKKALEIDRAVGANDRVHRWYVAWAYLRLGNTAAARTMLGDVPYANPDDDDSFDYVIPRLIAAEALYEERRHHDALNVARAAVRAMRRIGSERGLGSALRVQAEIQSALGESGSASRSIDEAVALLGRSGPPYALAQAYRCSAKVTGNRRHRRIAGELMQLFRMPT